MLDAMATALSGAYRKLIFAVVRTPYYIEHTVVLAFEALQRLRARRDPRLHNERLRIRQVTEGEVCKNTDKFVVFVIYAEGALPQFTMNFVTAVRRSPFDLVAVANCPLTPEARRQLVENCCLLVERENFGQDFGGYKDGISVIQARFAQVQRIVLANDSVYYLKEGLDQLLAGLDGEDDFIGVSEIFDHHYHVASFLMSFGPRVLRSAAFRQFWKRYLPIGTRRWAIFWGEGALTAELLRAGFKPHVLFRAQALRPHLEAQNADALSHAAMLLPAVGRRLMAQRMRKWGLREQGRVLDAMAGGEAQVIPGDPQPVVEAIVDAIEARNQMHMGGFLFRKYLGLPIIKRDILFRQVHTPGEMERVLGDLDSPLRAEIMKDALRRGTTADFGFWRKLLARHSAA
jgi:hypothetical protein